MIEYENLYKMNKGFTSEFQDSFLAFLNSGRYILGNEVDSFESEFSQYHNTPNTVGVASGLDASTISLISLEINKGTEVSLPLSYAHSEDDIFYVAKTINRF